MHNIHSCQRAKRRLHHMPFSSVIYAQRCDAGPRPCDCVQQRATWTLEMGGKSHRAGSRSDHLGLLPIRPASPPRCLASLDDGQGRCTRRSETHSLLRSRSRVTFNESFRWVYYTQCSKVILSLVTSIRDCPSQAQAGRYIPRFFRLYSQQYTPRPGPGSRSC